MGMLGAVGEATADSRREALQRTMRDSHDKWLRANGGYYPPDPQRPPVVKARVPGHREMSKREIKAAKRRQRHAVEAKCQ